MSARPLWMNPANLLTLLRIALVPGMVYALLEGHDGAALALFLLAGLSDGLDGHIARRYHMVTRLGALLDPLADKLLIAAAFLTLAALEALPLWLTALVVARDGVIMAGALTYRTCFGRVEMAPSSLSKFNTFLQLALVTLALLERTGLLPTLPWHGAAYAVVAFSTVASGGHYIWAWSHRAAQAATQGH